MCSDKTGTLTNGETKLEGYLALSEKESDRVLLFGYLNSTYQTGIKSPLDEAILQHSTLDVGGYSKIGEIPFDFERRCLSVAVRHKQECLLITKGAPESVLTFCTAYPGEGAIHLVHIVKLDTLSGEVLDPEDKEHMLQRAKTYLQSVVGHVREGLAAELHVTVTWSVALDRDAATGIIRVAENGEDAQGAGVFGACNMIALSTHGRGGLQRWAMGSVVERVLSGTRLPVLIVQPQQVAAESETSETKIRHAPPPSYSATCTSG